VRLSGKKKNELYQLALELSGSDDIATED
jgi:hypothetical protein